MFSAYPMLIALRNLGLGLWLFGVALATIVFVIFSLSAFQVQTRIQSFSAGGNSFSVWQLERLMQRKREIRNELIPLQKLLDELREKAASTRAAYYQAKAEYDVQGALQWQLIFQFTSLIATKNQTFSLPRDEPSQNTWYLYGIVTAEVERI